MTEHDTLVFLLSLAAMLASARVLGELARWLSMPLVAGEIAAGIALGPTALGRVAPNAQRWLFPNGAAQSMIGGYSTVAVVLLLVVVGLEVDLGVLRSRGRSAALTGLLGMVLPFASGVALGVWLPDSDLLDPARRTTVALLLGVALSISALPVIAKTLLDLGLFKSDVGLMVMAAAMIDDVVGWLVVSLLLGSVGGAALEGGPLVRTLRLGAIFAVAMLAAGRRLLGGVFARLQRGGAVGPGRVLSAVVVFALLGATGARALGLHAVFGGFVAGLAVGGSAKVNARTRAVVEDFVSHVFAPVFFAAIGLRVDFAAALDLPLCAAVFALAAVPKIVGCALGARLGGLKWREATAVGFGMNARGAMGVI